MKRILICLFLITAASHASQAPSSDIDILVCPAGASSTPAYCLLDETGSESMESYGGLYNWWVIDPANPKNIAPMGGGYQRILTGICSRTILLIMAIPGTEQLRTNPWQKQL